MDDPVLEKYIVPRNVNCSVLLGLKLTATGKAVTYTSRLRAEYIAAQWVSGSGEKSIRFIDDGKLQYASNLAFHRGNVFTERLNDLLERIK